MTKKDYIKIAQVIRRTYLQTECTREEAVRDIIKDMIKLFKEDNILFNEDRFLNAIYH